MTEEEAREKWCPMSSIRSNNGGGYNRLPDANQTMTPRNTLCITSDCMMWRWSVSPETAKNEGIDEAGYCGLSR